MLTPECLPEQRSEDGGMAAVRGDGNRSSRGTTPLVGSCVGDRGNSAAAMR
jgi:hypothetical protein